VEFEELRRAGYEMGFTHVESGPLVRSSYHAAQAAKGAR
jgi:lipoic acid synthetase